MFFFQFCHNFCFVTILLSEYNHTLSFLVVSQVWFYHYFSGLWSQYQFLSFFMMWIRLFDNMNLCVLLKFELLSFVAIWFLSVLSNFSFSFVTLWCLEFWHGEKKKFHQHFFSTKMLSHIFFVKKKLFGHYHHYCN